MNRIYDSVLDNPIVITVLIVVIFALVVLAVILIKKYVPFFKSDEKPKTPEEIAAEEVKRLVVDPEEEEKKTLLPLPVAGYHSYTEREAAVGRDGYIQYSCAFYSVPPQYIKKKVIARSYEGRLYIYDDHRTLIAEHPIASRKWQRVTDPGH